MPEPPLPLVFPVPDWDPPPEPLDVLPPDPLDLPPPLPEEDPLPPEEEPLPPIVCELMFPVQPPSARALTSATETPVDLHGLIVVRPQTVVYEGPRPAERLPHGAAVLPIENTSLVYWQDRRPVVQQKPKFVIRGSAGATAREPLQRLPAPGDRHH
jgi:hypothetical protein